MPQIRHLLSPRPIPRLLSIVIPIYNEQDAIPLLRGALDRTIHQLPCPVEVILVNDGSTDNSVELLHDWSVSDPQVMVLCLARNFGQQAAITAGLDAARGDAVVIMDADLQDPPELIPVMLERYREGYDVVYGQRSGRQGEGLFKRMTAWLFYRMMRKLVHKDLPADTGDFRLISRPCLDALMSMRETHRFLRGMVAWVGFPQVAVPFERPKRCAGTTNYPLRKMIAFAWTAAISFSPVPLRLSLIAGIVLAMLGLGDAGYAIFRKLTHHTVPGWTSLMVLLSIIGGGILVSIGILGEYIGRIFEASKERPLYIVSRTFHEAAATQAVPEKPVLTLTPAVKEFPRRAAGAGGRS